MNWLETNDHTITYKTEEFKTDRKCDSDVEQDEITDENQDSSIIPPMDESESTDNSIIDSKNKAAVLFTYDSIYGEERQVKINGGDLSLINIPLPVSVPYINDDSEFDTQKVYSFETNTLNKYAVK